MGLLDKLLGVPPPPKKRHSDDYHRHQSGHGKASSSRADAARDPSASRSSSNPTSVEDLRRRRTSHFDKSPEERRRDAERSERGDASHHRGSESHREKKPDKGKGREERKYHRPRSRDRGSHREGSKRKDKSSDVGPSGYDFVYGQPVRAEAEERKRDGRSRSLFDDGYPLPPPSSSRNEPAKKQSNKSKKVFSSHDEDSATPLSWVSNLDSEEPPSPNPWYRYEEKKQSGSGTKGQAKQSEKDSDNSDTASIRSRPGLSRSRTTGHVRPAMIDPSSRRSSWYSRAENSYDQPQSSKRASAKPGSLRPPSTLFPIREGDTSSKTAPRPTAERTQSEESPREVDCDICIGTVPIQQTSKLACNHTWCHPCLKRTYFITPEGAFITKDPVCCNEPRPDTIRGLVLTDTERKAWDRKVREAAEKRPIYCTTKACNSRWISPRSYREDRHGVRFAECTTCRARVCLKCKAAFHGTSKCRKDMTTKEVLKMAEKEGYQRCYQCKILVERSEGCTHMTCRCGAEFCYKCGKPYHHHLRTCHCPLFDRIPVDNDGWDYRPGHYQPGRYQPRHAEWVQDLDNPRLIPLMDIFGADANDDELLARQLQNEFQNIFYDFVEHVGRRRHHGW